MVEDVTNELMYETLKAIRGDTARIVERLDRMERRLGNVEDLVGRLVQNDLHREREFSSLESRVARIERRLELTGGDA